MTTPNTTNQTKQAAPCCGACDCGTCSCGCAPTACGCAQSNCGCGCRD